MQLHVLYVTTHSLCAINNITPIINQYLVLFPPLQVRVMPNTPCLVGMAASAYSLGTYATPQDAERTHALLSSVGGALLLCNLFTATHCVLTPSRTYTSLLIWATHSAQLDLGPLSSQCSCP